MVSSIKKLEEELGASVYKSIPQVALDSKGTFKYILIQAEFKNEDPSPVLYFVRGFKKFEYHKEIFEDFKKNFKLTVDYNGKKIDLASTMYLVCPGGGRIIHKSSEKKLEIYGYSQTYGQANHDFVVELIKAHLKYPESGFKVRYDGYQGVGEL